MFWNSIVSSKLCRRRAQIPASTKYRLIFPFEPKTLTFNTSFYSPQMTDNRIQTSQLDSFFEEIYDTCKYFSFFSTWTESFYVPLYAVFMLLVIVIHILDEKFKSLAPLFVLCGILIMTGLVFWNLRRANKAVENYRTQIKTIMNYSNKTLYDIIGFQWEISEQGFDWLELKLTYKIEHEPNKAAFHDSLSYDDMYPVGRDQVVYPPLLSENFECLKQEIPACSETCLIFPFDYKQKAFTTYFYEQGMTERRFKADALKGFCDTLVERLGRIKYSKGASVLSWLQMGIIPIGIFYCLCSVWEENFFSRSLLCMLVCVMMVHVIEMFKDFRSNKLLLEERQNMLDFIQKYNREMRSLGLRWVLSPCHIDWLELWFDYKFISDDPLAKVVKEDEEFPVQDDEEEGIVVKVETEGANLLTSSETDRY